MSASWGGGVPKAADFEDDQDVPSEENTPLASQANKYVGLSRRLSRIDSFRKPRGTRVIVVANQKGGVGKTTTSVNMAAAMALRGLDVLLVDLDPQGNASTATGIDYDKREEGVYDVIILGKPMADVVQVSPDIAGLKVVPATLDLAGSEIELVSLDRREFRLRDAVDEYVKSNNVDYVIIDCPPSLGLLTLNAMVAAREVLIPIQCEYYALEGLSQLVRNVDLVKENLNPELEISTIVLTMHDGRTNLSASVSAEVRSYFGDKVLKTTIPRSVRISEAPGYQQTILTYDPQSTGALSYIEATREITMQER